MLFPHGKVCAQLDLEALGTTLGTSLSVTEDVPAGGKLYGYKVSQATCVTDAGGVAEYSLELVRPLGDKQVRGLLRSFSKGPVDHGTCTKPATTSAGEITQHTISCTGTYANQLDLLQVSGGWGLRCTYFGQKKNVKADKEAVSRTCLDALHGLG